MSSPNEGGGLFFIHEDELFKLDNFKTTGLSVKGRSIVRGVQPNKLWLHKKAHEITQNTVPFDDIHDTYIDGHFVYLVRTSGNEIIKLNDAGDEVQRWVFPGEKDALHINCLEKWNGNIVFSAFGEFREHRAYKGKTKKSGFVQDLLTGHRLITDLSQPHSLVSIGQNLLLANSEDKELSEYGPSGDLIRTLTLDGYTRGIYVAENTIYIGLSCSRNIENSGISTATVVAIDRSSWKELGRVQMPAKEIYGIQGLADHDMIHVLANITSISSSKMVAVITEREGQIASLNQAVTEREGQIAGLNQAVTERDGQIAGLSQAITERDGQLLWIQASRSWRITKPLRFIGRLLRGDFDNAFAPFPIRGLASKSSLKIAYLKLLARNSVFVLRQDGFLAFIRRTVSFLVRRRQRKIASSALEGFSREKNVPGANPTPLVSFVIPIYDRVDVLRVAVNSVLAQTQQVFEVILVTDGSPAQTMAVVEEFRNNPLVRIFSFPTSSGNAVRGRNKAILEAKGKYIAFLDSDDIAAPDRLEVCLPILESGFDVVYGGWRALLDGTREIDGLVNGQEVYSPDCDLSMLEKICVPCQSTVMVRRDMLLRTGFLKHKMEYREDHELWLRLAHNGAKFKSVPYVLTDLRLHAGNNELNFKGNDSHWETLLKEEYRKKGLVPKKIAFLLAGLGISGGAAVVLKHVSLLIDEGHDAFVIDLGGYGDIQWFGNPAIRVYNINNIYECGVGNIDMLFATFWTTVDWLDKIQAKRKLYLVQSDERLFYDDNLLKDRIEQTYKKDIEYVGIAQWIVDFLRVEFGHSPIYLPNGLDTALFYPDTPLQEKNPTRLRVLIEGPISVPFKGMTDAYAAVSELDCDLWIVSSDGVPEPHWRYDRFFQKVKHEDMRKIYSSCDILLKMSKIESFAYPPLEAMACECTVVIMDVDGGIEYAVDGKNVLKVKKGDIQGAKQAVKSLIEDDLLRSKLRQGGFDTVQNFSWDPAKRVWAELTSS